MQVLAFGGKGVLWFTYAHPPYPEFRQAMLNDDGTPTPQYEEVKQINADLRRLGAYLLDAQSTLVFENGALPVGGTPPPASASVTLQGTANITVGEFWKAPYTYVLLASRDYRAAISTNATFKATTLQRLDKTTSTWTDIDPAVETNVTLLAGDAELFRLLK